MKKVIEKGYTLTVVSWENDGDYYSTHSKTVQTLEEAKVWWEMMQLCKSHSGPEDIIDLGNSHGGFNKNQIEMASDFIKKHHKILLVPDDNIEEYNNAELSYWFCDLAGELLGRSEDYACRVAESCVITYSNEDVYLEEIKF